MAYRILETACTGCGACVRICPVDAISGERRQAHHIQAALCIDCGACGKVCKFGAIETNFLQPAQNLKHALWQSPVWDEALCVRCVICRAICPTGAISLDPVTRFPALAHPDRCIACAFCAAACPVDAIAMIPRAEPTA